MEMAGIVCYTGAGIIKCARELIEQIGKENIFVSEHFYFLLTRMKTSIKAKLNKSDDQTNNFI